MTPLALVAIMLLTGGPDMPNKLQSETVCMIVENDVCDAKHPRKKVVFKQFIFKRWRAGGYQIVGYLMLRDGLAWQYVKRGDYHCIEFESRSGEFRTIRSKSITKEDTRHDPEVRDRENGERECLFGLQPWGDVRG